MTSRRARLRKAAPWLTSAVALALLLLPAPEACGQALAEGSGGSDTVAPDAGTAVDTATPPDAEDLLGRYDDLYDSSGTTASVEVTITTPTKTRTLKMRFWAQGDDKALMIIDAPPRDAGTATLKVGHNLWNYLPKISRTIRVPPSLMMGSWMGSDLTNDDIIRDASYRDDYEPEHVVWSRDPAGWEVRMTARPEAVGLWSAVEMVFEPKTYLPVLARFYDRRGRLSRTMVFDEVKTLGGRRVPTHIVIIPEQEKGRKTEFRYLDATFDANVPDDTFSLSRLERAH
jgi:outer membrane lipoprotein-sorting protein